MRDRPRSKPRVRRINAPCPLRHGRRQREGKLQIHTARRRQTFRTRLRRRRRAGETCGGRLQARVRRMSGRSKACRDRHVVRRRHGRRRHAGDSQAPQTARRPGNSVRDAAILVRRRRARLPRARNHLNDRGGRGRSDLHPARQPYRQYRQHGRGDAPRGRHSRLGRDAFLENPPEAWLHPP